MWWEGFRRHFPSLLTTVILETGTNLGSGDIDQASVHLVFEAVAYVKANPVVSGVLVAGAGVAVSAVSNTVSGAYKVITDIAAAIGAKRNLKGSRIATTPASFNDGEVVIESPDGPIMLTKEQYELLLSRPT